MAHTDACKIQATQFMKKLVDSGMSVTKASEITEKESDGIPAETLRSWWYQINKEITSKTVENSTPTSTTSIPSEIPEKQDNQEVMERQQEPGPGRPQKYQKPPEPWSCAMQMAGLAIGQLGRIPLDDPKREEAFKKVIEWIDQHLD